MIDFEEMLDDVIISMEYIESSKNVKIIRSIEQECEFISDKVRLNIVLSNLISNSLKYFDPQKDESFLEIKIKVNSRGALIVFEDNGIGIAHDQLDKVFKIFYRASESSYGSGLGLYIVREIVNKVGGTINVESIEGEYTRFVVFLPSRKAENQSPTLVDPVQEELLRFSE